MSTELADTVLEKTCATQTKILKEVAFFLYFEKYPKNVMKHRPSGQFGVRSLIINKVFITVLFRNEKN